MIARKYPYEYRTSRSAPLSPLYRTWQSMMNRCFDQRSVSYHRYGGRGITVASAWAWWPTFADWAIKSGWDRELQIDRIDNDGNYSPDNCRFVTASVNCQNRDMKRMAVMAREAQVMFHGKLFRCVETDETFVTQVDAMRKHGVDRKTLRMALQGYYKQAGGLHWVYL